MRDRPRQQGQSRDTRRGDAACIAVDDHEAVLSALVELLEHEGFSVVGEAATGGEALALLEGQRPDLAVIDFDLPDMTGVEVARKAAAVSPATAFVLYTAMEPPSSTVREAHAAGIREIVLKGTPPNDLLEVLYAVLSAAAPTHRDDATPG